MKKVSDVIIDGHRKVQLQGGGAFEGTYRVMVTEPPILITKRMEFFAIHGNAASFVAAHGRAFSGSTKDYLLLPQSERDAIDSELSLHVKANPKLWNRNTDRKVNWDSGVRRNLILDSGLNYMCNPAYGSAFDSIGRCFSRCWVGTGTTPTVVDSGAITVTIDGAGNATASGAFFTAGMVNQLLNCDTGEQQYITAFTDSTHVTVSGTNVVAAQLFAVYAVNQTGMVTPTKSTETYLTGTGNCGTADSGSAGDRHRTMYRTYDFTAEVANINYTELGWTSTGQPSSALWSRTLVTGGTVTVLIGQALRVYYSVNTVFNPSVSTPGTLAVTGWPVAPAVTTDGDYGISFIEIDTVTTAGTTTSGSGTALDPRGYSSNKQIQLSTATTYPTWGSPFPSTNAAWGAGVQAAYVAGSFEVNYSYTFLVGAANRTDWRQVQFGQLGGACAGFVLDEAQTKDNLHTLTLSVRMTYSRIFTNP